VNKEHRSVLLILADGASCDAFERLLSEGRLPAIRKHVIERGGYARMTTVFTSSTGPAYLPFLTGCFPGTADIPGIRWFDRKAFAEKPFWSPHRFRSYCGWEAPFFDRDLHANVRTMFELVPDSVNVLGPVTRGLRGGSNLRFRTGGLFLALAHAFGWYEPLDRMGAQVLLQNLSRPAAFRFVVLPAIDGISHNTAPSHERTLRAYQHLDRTVERVANALQEQGTYDCTAILVCSDHGLSPTHTHFDVARFLRQEMRLSTLYYPIIFKRRPQASVHVSGNAMAHVYLRNGADWRRPCFREDIGGVIPGLKERLLDAEAVDMALTRDRAGWIWIESRRGCGRVRERGPVIEYETDGGDPFGYSPLPKIMTMYEALERTFDSDYPDGPVQAAQIFRSRRCGDLVLSATPGFDFRNRWEFPEHRSSHGSLHRLHMMTPFACSFPFEERALRSVDVFPSMLAWLDRPLPERLDGMAFMELAASFRRAVAGPGI
jgi:hypothetical protein